jgi:LuxR family maltose regulon positive regulatory protein
MNFSIPRVPRVLVAREEVSRRLDVMSGLTHVRTLGGCGATTLVATWARRRHGLGDVVVWCDPRAEMADFEAAVQRATSVSATSILVIDNAELARDSDVASRICQIVIRSDHVNVVVIGESAPLREHARHHGLDRTVITARDLAVDIEQAHEFAQSWGYDVSSDLLRGAHQLVAGHLLGLRIALSGNASVSDSPDKDGVCVYIRHDFVGKAGQDQLVILAGLAALTETVTGAMVEELADLIGLSSTADQVLSDLGALALVHRAPGDDGWVFAPTMAEALTAHVQASNPTLVTQAHGIIARILFASGGPPGLTVKHARLARLWGMLADVWVRESIVLFERHGRLACEAYGGLPDVAVLERPVLAIAAGWARAARLDVVAPRVPVRSTRDVAEPLDGTNRGEVLAEATARIMVLRQSGDLAAAMRLAADLEPVATQQDPNRTVDWFTFQWAVTDMLAGHFAAASRRFSRLAAAAPGVEPTAMMRAAAAHLAMLRAMTGEVDAARHWLEEFDRPCADPMWLAPWTQTPRLIAQILLDVDTGDLAGARTWLDQIGSPTHEELWACVVYAATQLELADGSAIVARNRIEHGVNLHRSHLESDSLARYLMLLCRCEAGLAMGEVNRVQALLARQPLKRWLWGVEARLRLISGEVATALELSQTARMHPGISPRERVEHAFIVAAAFHALGHYEQSREASQAAHDLARTTGMVTACRKVPVAVCVGVCDRDQDAREEYPAHAELVSLTPRELQVLHLLREHRSLSAVAEVLTVSVNTVKKQSVSIHAKLGVKDRAAALMRAEALGLLDTREDVLF